MCKGAIGWPAASWSGSIAMAKKVNHYLRREPTGLQWTNAGGWVSFVSILIAMPFTHYSKDMVQFLIVLRGSLHGFGIN